MFGTLYLNERPTLKKSKILAMKTLQLRDDKDILPLCLNPNDVVMGHVNEIKRIVDLNPEVLNTLPVLYRKVVMGCFRTGPL